MHHQDPFSGDHSGGETQMPLEANDYVLIQERVKYLKYAPLILRIFMGIVLVGFLAFTVIIFGFDWFNMIFVGIWGGFWIVAEYLLRKLMNKLKVDLQNRKKKVLEGWLMGRDVDYGSTNDNKASYYWTIGEEKVVIPKKDYGKAKEGDRVRVSSLPLSKVVFLVERLQ